MHAKDSAITISQQMAAFIQIERIDIVTFDVAYDIIGGGEEGNKKIVRTKEQADHSLPFMTAVALLEGQVLPEQYLPQRIRREDVQSLMQKIQIRPSERFSARFPDEMPCQLTVRLKDNRKFEIEKDGYEGFHTQPMSWKTVGKKFEKLAEPFADQDLRREIVETAKYLDSHNVRDLTELLAQVRMHGGRQ